MITYEGEVVFRVAINLLHQVWVWADNNIFSQNVKIKKNINSDKQGWEE